ncbi:unnamed protein product [Acanthoscelides obtectus]|uniref:HTH psq-type domain-containing protein n=1 Tax=Acanthoscelides obtectus TaxID=200917 RepID=A0A9P0JWH9_ACAOB|nr:unnamed protein product [Acanthoscelides obtectus]CAK1623763.1 hypothetical protein AOBTE_LOCUS2163 [Acanthoscelides obtectus]
MRAQLRLAEAELQRAEAVARDNAEDEFNQIFKDVETSCKEMDIEMALPRTNSRQTQRNNVPAEMPNKYVRKTDRGVSSAEIYELAFEEVTFRGQSLRSAASAYNINYMSLQRYIKKKKAYQANLTDKPPSVGTPKYTT